ncbi:MAG TPA: alpha-amylase family glycosyl hydrolase [Terriglobia bacterium]|nr:alpha-amylase family glycosyl hydrolase [Terriglobia bacterium]
MPPSDGRRPPKLRRHPHLYEINTWAWLEDLSARKGKRLTLGGVPNAEWDHLRELGFDLVWLMGVWKRSPAGRRIVRTDPSYFGVYDAVLPGWTMSDVVGSPYSIQDYRPDPQLGTWDEIDAVRRSLHARDMKLILDFVPNHTALDHPWIDAHPEYYVQGTLMDFRKEPAAFFLSERADSTLFIARGKDPYFPPWADTAQLNYYNPATRDAMLGVLGRLADHCDGARCDMAMLSLNDIFGKTWGPLVSAFPAPQEEFWPSAIAALPGFVWIGEVYWEMEPRLQQLGFDFTYDKGIYDCLLEGRPHAIRSTLSASDIYQNKSVRFLENHDERRSAAAFGKDKLRAVASLVATLPGMRFYHQGQFEARKLHLPIQLRRVAEEAPDGQIQALYQRLLDIARRDAFHEGDWRLLETRSAGDPSFDELIAYEWRLSMTLKIVVVNVSANISQGRIILGSALDSSVTYRINDELNNDNYERRGRDLTAGGLFVRLEGYQSRVLDISPK